MDKKIASEDTRTSEIKKDKGYTVIDAVINLELGLCVRASGSIAIECEKYDREIYFRKRKKSILCNGKSPLELMSMVLPKGSKLQILVEGEDKEAEKIALRLYRAVSTYGVYPYFSG